MDYLTLKALHQLLALVSVTGFIARWSWRLRRPDWRPTGLLRAAPHGLDTLLVISGLWLAARIDAFDQAWLHAKLAGLVVYIVLAWLAFRTTDRRGLSLALGLSALACIAWVATVAVTHQAGGILKGI
ncbi:MAG: SirB2 family protein [Pseudomonadota bacterium]